MLLVGLLLGWDWVIKSRRAAQRPEMNDHEFLSAYRGPQASDADAEILGVRRRIAKELHLPESKIRPSDGLTDLRDRYCLVIDGHLALGDLFDDLQDLGATSSTPAVFPETVHDYVAAFLERSSIRRSNDKRTY